MNIKDKFIEEFKDLIKRNDVKSELKELFRPIIDLILIEIYPFIYISLVFVVISFLLILAIFVLVLRNKSFVK
jgi:hypothetical protein